MTNQELDNKDSSRAFMDALTASDKGHRRAMRGLTPEIAATLIKRCYGLTDEQAKEVQRLRDVVGLSEDEAVQAVVADKIVSHGRLL